MWLESHGNLARHPKTRRLMQRMGWTLPATIGNLHLLWYWALDFAPTGDLSRFEPEQLTYDLDLGGATPKQFIEAMIEVGFLDRGESGTLRLHDWPDYTAKSLRPLLARSSRPGTPGQDTNLVVPPGRDRRNPERWHQVLRSYGLPVITRRNPRRDTGASAPPMAESTGSVEHGSQDTVRVDRADPNVAHVDNAAQTLSQTEPNTARTPALDLPTEQQRANLRRIRGEVPRALSLVPGFTDVWWLRLLEMYKNRGTPLDSNQRRELLARLCMRPNSSVRLLMHCVENSLDCKWEHLPNTS